MLKKTKITLFTSIACIFLGCLIFGITVVNNNYYFDEIFYPYDYSTKSDTISLSAYNEIEINLREVQIFIYKSTDNELRLTYNEYKNRKYLFNEKTNQDKKILNITIKKINWTSYLTFNLPLKNTAKLYIPINIDLKIKIHKNDDNVVIKDNAIKDDVVLI